MNGAFKAEDITLNAHQWTFEGDCKLLEWMKQITENLGNRTEKTTEAFDKLNTEVKRANIALDNAANSLTALQYTQFMESRCHDDDETIANQAEVPVDLVKSDNEPKSTTEVFKTFLENNLKMLHNCHEKYAIDFDDSDDEDSTNNCIYQAKNPYNDRLLPHIFGSKLWKENWHVGLCDGANDYSGDEKSEAFSESTSSLDDTVSYESNNANLSQWASSASMNDSLSINVPMPKPILHGPTNLLSEEQRLHLRARQAAGSSESSSSPSRSLSNKPDIIEHDLFASFASTQPTTIPISTTTTAQEKEARINSDLSQSSSLNSSNNTLPTTNTQYNLAKEDDISNAIAEKKVDLRTNQIKRKPVNLFDDDDFNSLMTQITDKAQAKTEINGPIKAAAGQLATDIEKSIKQRDKVSGNVDLFDEHAKSPITLPSDKKIEKPQVQTQKRLNLFDSPDISPTTESLFPSSNIEESTEKLKETKTKITAKSLFDDDDDEDDFLNVFGTKKPSRDLHAKTLLFVDDTKEENDIFVSKKNTAEKSKDLFEKKKMEEKETVNVKNDKIDLFGDIDNSNSEISKSKKPTLTKKSNLFEDDDNKNDNINTPLQKNNDKQSQLFNDEAVADAKSVVPNLKKKIKKNVLKTAKKSSPSKQADIFAEDPNIAMRNHDLNTAKNSLSSKQVDIFAEEMDSNSNLTPSNIQPNLFLKENISSDTTEITNAPKASMDLFADVEHSNIIPSASQSKKTKTDIFDIKSDISKTEEGNQILGNKTENLSTVGVDKLSSESDKSSKGTSIKQNEAIKQSISNSKKLITDLFESNVEDDDLFLKKPNQSEDSIKILTRLTPTKPTTVSNITNISDNINEKTENLNTKIEDDWLSPVDVRNNKELTTNESINKTTPPNQLDEPPTINDNIKVETEITVTENNENITDTVLENKDSSTIIDDDVYEEERQPMGSTKLTNTTSNYAGIFLDEPPDDDDFFQSIGSSNKTNIANNLDNLENDFYEPPLPQTPATTINTPQEKSDSIKRSNDYSSLHLFSDIPPDDDDEVADIPNTNETKRLHSIFYDDFLETQSAINNPTSVPTHSLFDDEPPPDDDIFNTLPKPAAEKEATKTPTADVTDHQEKVEREGMSFSTSTIAFDNKINSKNESAPIITKQPIGLKVNATSEKGSSIVTTKNIINDKINTKRETKPDVTINETTRKSQMHEKSDLESIERVQSKQKTQENVVSKLKLPKININVQALLPNAGGKPNFKKTISDEPKTTTITKTDNKETTDNETPIKSQNPANENILTSLVKDRVRIPVKRRPSTRKARQENYLKSVLNEEEPEITDEGDLKATNILDENTIKKQSTNIKQMETTKNNSTNITNSIKANEQTEKTFIEPHREKVVNSPTGTIAKAMKENSNLVAAEFQQKIQNKLRTADIFQDDNDDNDDFLFKPTTKTKESNSSKETTKTPNLYNTEKNDSIKSNKPLVTPTENNRDDDLLKHPTKLSTHTVNTPTTSHSLFRHTDDQSSDDDLFESSMKNSTKPLSSTKTPSTKVAAALNIPTSKSLFGDEEIYSSDENLFKSTNKSTQKSIAGNLQKEIKEKKSLLFESDGEDDDDFLTAIKKKDEIKTKPNSLNQDKGKSLFSDIESDDDDLFNAKPGKTGITAKSITTNPAAKQTTRQPQLVETNTSKTKTASPADDPLADLLNS